MYYRTDRRQLSELVTADETWVHVSTRKKNQESSMGKEDQRLAGELLRKKGVVRNICHARSM